MKEVLGVDIGGVIIRRARAAGDTSFLSFDYLKTPAEEGAFETLARLVTERFGRHVHLVSKCKAGVRAKTLDWLADRSFYDRTGVHPKNVHFCVERSEKAGICRKLGVTHFIDDRIDVLWSLQGVNKLYLFQPPGSAALQGVPARVHVVRSWEDLARELLSAG